MEGSVLKRALPLALLLLFVQTNLAWAQSMEEPKQEVAPPITNPESSPPPTTEPTPPVIIPEPTPPIISPEPEPAPITRTERTGLEVFQRIAGALDPASCTPAAARSTWMKNYIHIPRRFEQQLQTALPILDYVSYETQRRGLPMEYALIPFVESRYLPNAVAKGGPTGLWQIMPITGKHYGLRIGGKNDGRLSAIDSTRAALEYLEMIQRRFKHWQTGIMAYNAGDSRVRNSLKKQQLRVADVDARLPTGFAPHTYAYVKKIQALSCFFLDSTRFNVQLPNDTTFKTLVPMPVIKALEAEVDNGN